MAKTSDDNAKKKPTKAPAKKAVAKKPKEDKVEQPKVAEPAVAASATPVARPLLPKIERRTVGWILSAALVVLLIVTTIFGVLIYRYKSESSIVYDVARVIPYPVERVNGQFVS